MKNVVEMNKKIICIGIVSLFLLMGLSTIATARGIETKSNESNEVYYRVYYFRGKDFSGDSILHWGGLENHAKIVVYNEEGNQIAEKEDGVKHIGDAWAEFYEFSDLDSYRGENIEIKVYYKGQLKHETGLVKLPDEGSINGIININIWGAKSKLMTQPNFQILFSRIVNAFPLFQRVLKL